MPSGEPRASKHLRIYPVTAFRTETGERTLFRRPPQRRWIDLPHGHLPVILARHDFDLAVLVDRPAGAVVRGAYGFAPSQVDSEPTAATFRISLTSTGAADVTQLMERTLRSGEEAFFEKFEVTIPGGRGEPCYVGFEVTYSYPDSDQKRWRAAWADPVIEEMERAPKQPPAAAPNILLITADTTRRDALGTYGGPASTVALDQLASSGIVFNNAFSVAYGTTPSHASLFTASYAAHHGVYTNQLALAREHVTLAEAFHDLGYHTAAFVSSVPAARGVGFSQGFDLFDDIFGFDLTSGLQGISEYERRADVTVDRFLTWLDRTSTEPFFVWLHLNDPHQPYAPPPEDGVPFPRPADAILAHFETPGGAPRLLRLPKGLRERARRFEQVKAEAVKRYYAEIRFMDRQIGRVLDRLRQLGLYEDMIITFVSDHGENLSERGHPLIFQHHGLLAGVTRLPMILKLPKSESAGSRYDYLVGNLDIAPTLLDLAGFRPPEDWQGRSFERLLYDNDRDQEFRPFLVLEGGSHQEISVRTRRWMYRMALGEFRTVAQKLLFLGYEAGRPEELYDLQSDPEESHALDPGTLPEVKRFKEILRVFQSVKTDKAEKIESQEHLDALKALGYVQ